MRRFDRARHRGGRFALLFGGLGDRGGRSLLRTCAGADLGDGFGDCADQRRRSLDRNVDRTRNEIDFVAGVCLAFRQIGGHVAICHGLQGVDDLFQGGESPADDPEDQGEHDETGEERNAHQGIAHDERIGDEFFLRRAQ